MSGLFQGPRQAWLARGFALLLVATSIVVLSLGGITGAGAASRPTPAASRRPTAVPPRLSPSQSAPTIALRPGASRRATAFPVGTIAYTKNYTELHLIQPDASNDHVIWSEPAGTDNSLDQLAWRPDSAEVAFVSNHEQGASLYQSDIYGVRPDGTGYRRISNPPDASQLGGYPTGSVSVTVFNQDINSAGPYLVYMDGAPVSELLETTVPAGTSSTVTFTNVAIFPNATQYPVVINGLSRWIYPPSGVVLKAGQTVSTTAQISANQNLESWGAFNPAWRHPGAQIDFALGTVCLGISLPTNPPPGAFGTLLLTSPASGSMCAMDRGPTPALANQVAYWDAFNTQQVGFYQVTEGSTTVGTIILPTNSGELVYSMRWLPDGTGFLFSKSDSFGQSSNIFEYDFATQTTTQLTQFGQMQYAGYVSVSPDGSTIIFEYSPVDPNPVLNPHLAPDLYLMPRDLSAQPTLLVANGRYPSWSQSTPVIPPPVQPRDFLPVVRR